MKRFDDWPSRLDAAVEEARKRPFAWGVHDCALFAADMVLAVTGRDLASSWRGGYGSARQALRALRGHGGLAGVATKALGDPVSPAQAMRGDVVMTRTHQWPALGICLGAKAAFTGYEGLVFLPMKDCEQAWHV